MLNGVELAFRVLCLCREGSQQECKGRIYLVCFHHLTKRTTRLFIAYNNDFLGFRGLTGAVAADAYSIEIDTRMQATATIDAEIPVDGVAIVVRCTMLLVLPEVMARHIEDVENDIHIAANAVVDNSESCGRRGRVVGTLHVEEGGGCVFRHLEIQLAGGGVVQHVPSTELQAMRPFAEFRNAEANQAFGVAAKVILEIVVERIGA